ncbi:hypothetical protein C8F01DRAFT_1320809 [Mycena amicta]|nr:hypothetical protein C8F01DRAFT_1320809 [Mycena amicta]
MALSLEVISSLLAASLAAMPIPGNPAPYAFSCVVAYWALRYLARFTPNRRLSVLKDAISTACDILLRAQSLCILDQASLAYENARLLRCEHLMIELEDDLRDLLRGSWIGCVPAMYNFLRKFGRCIKEVHTIQHRIQFFAGMTSTQHLVANEKKRKLARAANDAKQDYATLSSARESFLGPSRRANEPNIAFKLV